MDELLDILKELKPDVDFETEKSLIDNAVLDSFDIVQLVTQLKDAFDIDITPADLMYLQTSGEEILISPYGYYRLKKCPYYADKKLSSIAKNVEENKYKII